MSGGSDGLLHVMDLDLCAEVHLGIRRQVKHSQDFRLWSRDGAHLVNVMHGRLRLRDPSNILGVPLLRLATSDIFLLRPSGCGLTRVLVASRGRLHLPIEACLGGGEVAGQSSQLRRQR